MQKDSELALASDTNFSIPEKLDELVSEIGKNKMFVVKSSETIIWENLKNGDETALGELYKLHIDALFSYGIVHSQDRGYVMDCIHDLFVDLYKYRKSLSKTDNVKYYLFKSLKRKINKKYHRKIIPVSMEYDFLLNDTLKNYTKSHEEEIINDERSSEKSAMLSNALNTLTKKQRKGLYLRFNQQRTYEEISEIMGVSVQSARTTIYRALKTLR
ncbi:RNA polymerase sigma factor [Flagellimonas eckloniae]|uniref:RNA polymerase sigma factor 70 region 4 type 2 domain-containing protein n=1 Tax=Flagellimonas eckloniae TaxID=346185 RepID=A0A0Q0XFU2_9FLAO|nr:sigma-70 family RNA polymerase sigma factor [Allomuricauda eckloniae]KQC29976.1 hypothetical protein AAY42_08875 [Allomuricauda eckloniae]